MIKTCILAIALNQINSVGIHSQNIDTAIDLNPVLTELQQSTEQQQNELLASIVSRKLVTKEINNKEPINSRTEARPVQVILANIP